MSNKKSMLLYLTFFYVLTELTIYVSFMTGDINGSLKITTITWLKYSSVLLCLLYSVIVFILLQEKDTLILAAALFFTGLSDYFLLFTNSFTFGMLSFSIVQLIYLLRLWYLDRGAVLIYRSLLNLLLWAGALTILKLLGIMNENTELSDKLLLYVASFYFVTILHNVIRSFIHMNKCKSSKSIIFSLGMFLFIFCDINVGIYNLEGFIAIDQEIFHKLYQFAEVAMWMFYLPAQVCIALSGSIESVSKVNLTKK
ncbi:lysoplasmalogenase family protein [Anaerocolumna sp. AGMB13020]|uniref:lysoplasmalogenase family protein n=1 Tax=Anaerocolumna sp. AGMB13020 TaxID=3081750 RepID=UPI002954690A|nr:lysoplasmalogenase family protein [Anaerocolumna sp. AGMB13020]WOO36716.1 lysoplasmalogenase family protein [Anaerocolumna sp. AGMB13020]